MTIIMEVTLPLLCKTQDDLNAIMSRGFKLKQLGEIKYLVKYENEKH
jgi:hypothetical protein